MMQSSNTGIGRSIDSDGCLAGSSGPESERMLRVLVQNAPAIVFLLDKAGIFQLSEGQALSKLGLVPGQVVGQSALEIYKDVPSVAVSLRQALQGEWARSINELPGAVFETAYSPYFDSAGRQIGVVGIAIDVTQRQQAEERIRKLNEDLERRVAERTAELKAANDELEAFAYSVSHDLRAPLRAVDGYARMLEEDYGSALDAEGQRMCGVVRDSARRMGQLIDDLLAFSRVGRVAMEALPIHMTDLAKGVFAELTAAGQHAAVDFRLSPLPQATGDVRLLRQVWTNLLANALKFSSKQPNPRVEVRGWQENGELFYCVRDNGAGFETEYAAKLFGVFQRLHSEREFPGTGVGLAIVQRVIQRHGGRVWGEGKVNQGAAFSFSLPGQRLP